MKKLEKVHSDALTRFQSADDFERQDRLLMAEDLKFASGDQWPEEIVSERLNTDRMTLTFNRLPAFIEQVLGDARQNKPSIKVHPVDSGSDIETAEIYEGLIRNIEGQSKASIAYITGLTHAVTGSRGGWRVVTEYADDDTFEQDVRIRRIVNPFSIYWDPNAIEYDKSDATWCFVSEWMTKEVFEIKYPDDTPTDWEGAYHNMGTTWSTSDRVRVSEYWVKEPVDRTINEMVDGAVIEGKLTDPEILPFVVRSRKVKSHKVVRYLLTGHAVIEGPDEFPSKYIPIIPVFGVEEFVGDQIQYRSLIRHAKDPQKMYNLWQTSIAEKILQAPKAPWLVTANMIKGLESMWGAANTEHRAYLPYNPDPDMPGASPQRQQPAAINQAEMVQSQQAVEDLKATMGMYDASLGAQGNETSGRAILARQREGDTATFAWIDNLARSIEHTGRILIDVIPRIYDTQRIIRVLGEDDTAEMVPINTVSNGELINDITVGKYDVAITTGPSYSTKRMESSDAMMQFVQAFPQAAAVTGDLIVKAMDWPGADAIAKRLKAVLPPGVDDTEDLSPEEQQMRQQQMQEAKQKEDMMFSLEVEGKQADTQSKKAKALKDTTDAKAQDLENDLIETGLMDLINNG